MSHSPEPWVVGAWEQMYVGKKMYYEFRRTPENIHSDLSVWTGLNGGERVHCSDWGKPSKALGEVVMSLAGEYSGTYLDFSEPNIKRTVACVNALAGLNPTGIHGLIQSVQSVVSALRAAQIQTGWRDDTNILSTLEGALNGCLLTPDATAH